MENKIFTCPCCGHETLTYEECELCGYNPEMDDYYHDGSTFNDLFATVDEE